MQCARRCWSTTPRRQGRSRGWPGNLTRTMYDAKPSKPNPSQAIIVAVVAIALLGVTFVKAGWPPFIIFTVAALIAYIAWLLTTYKRPADPRVLLPLYLLALAGQVVHTTEEYLADFPGAFAALFEIANPVGRDFFAVAIMGGFAAVWVLTAFGLLYRNPFANFLLWFFVIGPGLVNGIAHFAFPFIVEANYFPGLITVALPTIASVVLMRRLVAGSRVANTQ